MPQIKEIMTPSVEILSPNATATDAARKMKDLDVGAIPVCDGERLLGMVTDRDLVLRVMAMSRDPEQAKVSEAMTPGLVYCFEDQDGSISREQGHGVGSMIMVRPAGIEPATLSLEG